MQQQVEAIPDDLFLRNLLVGLWMKATRGGQVKHAFKESLARNDQPQVSFMNLAEIDRRTNRVSEAVKEYERLLAPATRPHRLI